jgi:hypothetical protein
MRTSRRGPRCGLRRDEQLAVLRKVIVAAARELHAGIVLIEDG